MDRVSSSDGLRIEVSVQEREERSASDDLTLDHVVGAPTIGIRSNPHIGHGPEAGEHDLTHLFPRGD